LPSELALLSVAVAGASALPHPMLSQQPLLAMVVIVVRYFWMFKGVSTDDSFVRTLV
jgi:hypothetical protein